MNGVGGERGMDGNGSKKERGQMSGSIVRYLWKWLPCLATAVVSLPSNAQTTVEYIHTDALGTPVAVTNSAGAVIERSEYEPYGKLLNRQLTDGPGFTGHVQDAATGLTYMQQRYYDPQIGRFLSVDPVTANLGNGANFNRYWYANNNPYKFTDPDGRLACGLVDCTPMRGQEWRPPGVKIYQNSGTSSSGDNTGSSANEGSSSEHDSSIVDLDTVKVTIDATDVGLASYGIFAPKMLGGWAQGDWAISRWIGADAKDLRRARNVAKVGNVVSFLTIGSSLYDLNGAIKSGDSFGIMNSSTDLGFGLAGMTGPVGAVGATAYGATSLLLEIPAVYNVTVTPLVDLACTATGDC